MALLSAGAAVAQFVSEATIDPTSVAATTVADQTFTINGLRPDMQVSVAMPSLEAGMLFVNAHVSAANTLKLRFFNQTASPIDPASQVIRVIAF